MGAGSALRRRAAGCGSGACRRLAGQLSQDLGLSGSEMEDGVSGLRIEAELVQVIQRVGRVDLGTGAGRAGVGRGPRVTRGRCWRETSARKTGAGEHGR